VQDRLLSGDLTGPPRLLVVNGLGRAHDLDASVPHHAGPSLGPGGTGNRAADSLDPVGVLETIMRDGPEVGVHTLVWCDTVELLHRRLGAGALREFGIRIGTAMTEEDSLTLLDSPYASTLRPHHALLYDEDRGRLVKLRPYALPPDDWSLPG
jgi:hypothetical protein